MKILVVPRIFHLYSHEENFYVNNYFITIGEREGYEGVPTQFNGDNILRLVFDDVTDEYLSSLRKFTKEDAVKIKNFADKMDTSKLLYVNCYAGISRSGAVGDALNIYLNRYIEQSDDYRWFFDNNLGIQPNSLVHRLLMIELGLTYERVEDNG